MIDTTQILALLAVVICILTNSTTLVLASPIPIPIPLANPNPIPQLPSTPYNPSAAPLVVNDHYAQDYPGNGSKPAAGGGGLLVLLPMMQQGRTVCRVGEEFGWVFGEGTFGFGGALGMSEQGTLKYEAQSLPGWMKFDPTTRRFSGTPPVEASGMGFEVTVSATSPTDPVTSATDRVSFFTQAEGSSPPIVSNPFSKQLLNESTAANGTTGLAMIGSAYLYSVESAFFPGIRVPPSWTFSLGLQIPFSYGGNNTDTPKIIYYSASLADGSKLPSWLSFDNSTLTFTGYSPDGNDGKNIYQIKVIGSDVYGYADIEQVFNLTIGQHFICIVNKSGKPTDHLELNLTVGFPVNGSWKDIRGLQLDGEPLEDWGVGEMVWNTSEVGSEWMSWDNSTRRYMGTPLDTLKGNTSEVGISLTDKFGDRLDTKLKIHYEAYAFVADQLPPVEIKVTVNTSASESVMAEDNEDVPILELKKYLTGPAESYSFSLVTVPKAAAEWLRLGGQASDPVVQGVPPSGLNYSKVAVELLATNKLSDATSQLAFDLSLAPVDPNAGLGLPQPNDAELPGDGMKRTTKVVIGLVASAAGLMLLLGVWMLIARKRTMSGKQDPTPSMRGSVFISPEAGTFTAGRRMSTPNGSSPSTPIEKPYLGYQQAFPSKPQPAPTISQRFKDPVLPMKETMRKASDGLRNLANGPRSGSKAMRHFSTSKISKPFPSHHSLEAQANFQMVTKEESPRGSRGISAFGLINDLWKSERPPSRPSTGGRSHNSREESFINNESLWSSDQVREPKHGTVKSDSPGSVRSTRRGQGYGSPASTVVLNHGRGGYRESPLRRTHVDVDKMMDSATPPDLNPFRDSPHSGSDASYQAGHHFGNSNSDPASDIIGAASQTHFATVRPHILGDDTLRCMKPGPFQGMANRTDMRREASASATVHSGTSNAGGSVFGEESAITSGNHTSSGEHEKGSILGVTGFDQMSMMDRRQSNASAFRDAVDEEEDVDGERERQYAPNSLQEFGRYIV